MHAKELIGKTAIRTEPTKGGDRSFMIGKGVKIINVSATHVYILSPMSDPYALDSEFMTGWVEFEPYSMIEN